MSSEFILRPKAGYDIREIEKNPQFENSFITEYEYGRIRNIYPTNPTTLYMFNPKMPPSYYADEMVGRINLAKPMPEDYFASGVSPFLQIIYRKAVETDGAAVSDFYRAIVDEFRIASDGKETLKMVTELVKWASSSIGYLAKFKEKGKTFYRAGKPMRVVPPLIPFRRGVNPIEEQVTLFVERKGVASYGDIKGFIIGGLGWLTNEGYLKDCIDKLVKNGNLQEFGDGYYKFIKTIEPF